MDLRTRQQRPDSGRIMNECANCTRQSGTNFPNIGAAMVRRLVDEVINGGKIQVIDELLTPALAGPAGNP
jgi:hypothetical protein